MPEMIDIYDGNHAKLGVLERSAVHKLGLWHQTFHCWVTGKRDGYGFVVLQLRSALKKNYPNMLDITAAGHLASGETPLDGVRELREEIGVSVDTSKLNFLGIKHDIADEPNGVHNREFAHVFLLRDDRKLDAYLLQEDEVSGLVELEINKGMSLFAGEVDSVECPAARIEGGELTSFTRSVRKNDLIPRVDNYYLKIFIMASLMLDDARYLSI